MMSPIHPWFMGGGRVKRPGKSGKSGGHIPILFRLARAAVGALNLSSLSSLPSDTNKPAGTAPPPVAAAIATVTLEGGMASPAKHAHAHVAAPQTTQQAAQAGEGSPPAGNNYARPAGQNVGNFLTDRPSSRVLAPPGGGSQITFG
jgi:hypothetical protein